VVPTSTWLDDYRSIVLVIRLLFASTLRLKQVVLGKPTKWTFSRHVGLGVPQLSQLPQAPAGDNRDLQGSKMNDDEARNLDHAWRYFSLHAEQRMTVFNFYVASAGLALTGLAWTLADGSTR
jgi:hypothetical protein